MLEIIPDINSGVSSTLLAIPNVLVKDFDLRGEAFRIAAGGRTGGITVGTEIDNVLLEIAGPVNPAPELAITAIAMSQTEVSLTWTSAVGLEYELQVSEDLSLWTAVQTGIAGNAGTTSSTLALPAVPASEQFYRVVELAK